MDTVGAVVLSLLFPVDWKVTAAVVAAGWVWVFLPPVVCRVSWLPWEQARGLAFLNVIFISSRCGAPGTADYEHLLRHELQHIKQQRIFSPWGCALFLGCWYFWHCIIKGRSFHAAWCLNPLEQDAEKAAYTARH
jgi:hypothetical protein